MLLVRIVSLAGNQAFWVGIEKAQTFNRNHYESSLDIGGILSTESANSMCWYCRQC